jgi:uncharacterized membrane protein
MKTLIAAAVAVSALAGTAFAESTIEFLPPGYALTSLATGGTAGAGNVSGDGSFETFRWTSADGVERLGLATAPTLGIGAGTPDISYDGQSVSASIVSTDLHMTQGVWRAASGWTETMPPMPANGVLLDNSYGTAWGLSGDGQTLTGYFWGVVDEFTRARACAWSSSSGMVSLGQGNDRSARVNAANYDGSVAVGWEERMDGAWRPTAWRGGTKITLEDTEAFCEAAAVNFDGSVITGSSYDDPIFMRVAAIWTWNGSTYDMQLLGVLPGTQPNFGEAMLIGVSADGTLAVGWNRYFQNPGGQHDGIVWTPSTGLINATTYIASLGLSAQVPPGMDIRALVAVSPDGSAFAGFGYYSINNTYQSFIIHITPPPCAGDADGNGVIEFADITAVLANFGNTGAPFAPGDADGSTVVNFADITTVLASFGTACP